MGSNALVETADVLELDVGSGGEGGAYGVEDCGVFGVLLKYYCNHYSLSLVAELAGPNSPPGRVFLINYSLQI
jgi:hypothetical protein